MNPFDELQTLLKRFRNVLISALAVETFGLFALMCLLLLSAGIFLFSVADLPYMRFIVATVFLGFTSFLIARFLIGTIRYFLNPILVARQLAQHHEVLGHGLETVVEIALCERKDTPPFSLALLQAEAERQIRLLKELKVLSLEKEVRRAKKPMLLAFLVLVFLSASLAFFPERFAGGARSLFGVTLDFLEKILPAEEVEVLAYDLKGVWVISHRGGDEKVDGLVTGAPKGTKLEISGKLFRASKQGSVTLECMTGTRVLPLNMMGSEAFSFSFVVEEKCVWRLKVMTTAGYKAIEKRGKEVMPIEIQPPRIDILGVDKITIDKNEMATVSYRAMCTTGIAYVDAVYRSTMDPSKQENSARVLEGRKGTNEIAGEMSVNLHSLGFDHVLLNLKVQCLLPEEKASSIVIPFSANKRAFRRLSLIIGLKEVIETLASKKDFKTRRQDAIVLLRPLVKDAIGLGTVKEETTRALSEALSGLTSGFDSNIETHLLKLLGAMKEEWRTLVLEQMARLEAFVFEDIGLNQWDEVGRCVAILLALNEPSVRRFVSGETSLLSDVISRLLASDLVKLREALSQKGKGEVAGRLLERIKERLFVTQDGILQVLFVSSKQMQWLNRVIERQREIMDETSQVAFELRKQRRTDVPRDVLTEALRLCQGAWRQSQKIKVEGQFKREMEGVLEKTRALCDLISAKDVASALAIAVNAEEQARGLVWNIKDYTQWEDISEEKSKTGTIAVKLISHLISNITLIRDKLASVLEERMFVVPREKKEEIKRIALKQKALMRDAERLFLSFGKSFERLSDAQEARENIRQAYQRLLEEDPSAAETHQRQAIQDLLRLKRRIARHKGKIVAAQKDLGEVESEEEMTVKATGSTWDVKSKVLEFINEDVPKGFEEVVKRYYESLTK